MEYISKFSEFDLIVEKFVCNKFGIAESFIKNYEVLNIKSNSFVLEVGCGVGPIAIYMATKGVYVDAVDINKRAIDLCNRNILNYKLERWISVILGNFDDISYSCKYDYIITNPPIDIMNDVVIDKKDIEKIENGELTSRTFSLITNAFKNESGKDLLTLIFEKADSLLKREGKIVIIFADLNGEILNYVIKLYTKYKFKVCSLKEDTVESERMGLPKKIGEYVNVYTMMVERENG